MINTIYLEQPLPGPSRKELELLGESFETLTKHLTHGEYLEAATIAETQWRDGVYDVRLLGYYLFGVFVERGMASLVLIFECLTNLLTHSWQYLGPDRMERHLESALHWLFTRISHFIEHYKRDKDQRIERWSNPEFQPIVESAFQRCLALESVLREKLPDGRSLRVFLVLRALLDENRREVKATAGFTASAEETLRTQEEEKLKAIMEMKEEGDSSGESSDTSSDSSDHDSSDHDSSDSDSSDTDSSDHDGSDHDGSDTEVKDAASDGSKNSSEEDSKPDSEKAEDEPSEKKTDDAPKAESVSSSAAEPASVPAARAAATISTGNPETLLLAVTPAMRVLLRKISAFQKLCETKRYRAAAILARDLQATLAAFDARRYLSSVLSGYFLTLVRHDAALSSRLLQGDASRADTMESALVNVLQNDLDEFVALAEELP